MPKIDVEKATDKFMSDLKAGKLKREKIPNPPPYFEGKEVEEISKAYDNFLESDLFETIKDLT